MNEAVSPPTSPDFNLGAIEEHLPGWHAQWGPENQYLFLRTTADNQRLVLTIDKDHKKVKLVELVDGDGNVFSIELSDITHVSFGGAIGIEFRNANLRYQVSQDGVTHGLFSAADHGLRPTVQRSYNMDLKTVSHPPAEYTTREPVTS